MCVCSGHCIIYVMAPLVFQTYYPGWTAALLWVAVIRTCFRVGTSHPLSIGQHCLCYASNNCLGLANTACIMQVSTRINW